MCTRRQCGCCLTLYPVSLRLHICHQDSFSSVQTILIFRKCCNILLIFEGGVCVLKEHKSSGKMRSREIFKHTKDVGFQEKQTESLFTERYVCFPVSSFWLPLQKHFT